MKDKVTGMLTQFHVKKSLKCMSNGDLFLTLRILNQNFLYSYFQKKGTLLHCISITYQIRSVGCCKLLEVSSNDRAGLYSLIISHIKDMKQIWTGSK
jgi:hypothetical protein